MPKKSRIDARPPRLSSQPACHRLLLHTPQTPACVAMAGRWRAGGGQAPGALRYIIARVSVQSIGKSVIRGEKISKAKRY